MFKMDIPYPNRKRSFLIGDKVKTTDDYSNICIDAGKGVVVEIDGCLVKVKDKCCRSKWYYYNSLEYDKLAYLKDNTNIRNNRILDLCEENKEYRNKVIALECNTKVLDIKIECIENDLDKVKHILIFLIIVLVSATITHIYYNIN